MRAVNRTLTVNDACLSENDLGREMADVGGSPLTRLCGLLNLLAAACLAVAILLYGIVKTRPSHHKHGPRESSSSRHHVDPFIGTAGVGHTSPGAHLPFGKVTLAPLTTGPLLLLTESPGEYSCNLYRRPDINEVIVGDRTFRGVAHTALSGGISLGPWQDRSRDRGSGVLLRTCERSRRKTTDANWKVRRGPNLLLGGHPALRTRRFSP